MDSPGTRGPLRIGVLGCASIAERRMLPSMLRQPRVRVTAVASRDAAKAASFAARFGGDPVVGYERLLERPDVDAVYIPLPPGMHAEWTLRSLAAGKHVLCEKPFATTLAEAREAVSLARERGLLLMESFMFLHHAQHAEVARLVADGAIGDLRLFSSEFGIPRPAGDAGDTGPRYASTLPEVAAYPLRAASLFLGDGLRVLGAQVRTEGEDGFRVAGTALLTAASGVAAQLAYGLDHGYRSGYTLWGSEGHLTLERAFSTPDDHAPVVRIERRGRTEEIRLAPDSHFTNIAGAFARTVLDGAGYEPHAEAILRHAELVDAVDTAASRS
ncbi:Gfo/Idh/MocA family oxidoreductase [Streptomyces roseoverticillatus]|uniref:Gfo/Idh/MocA family protein n=1 Tax=Streptomyces roseoverticillatus TaxID=66429 RepID=UPI0033D0B425